MIVTIHVKILIKLRDVTCRLYSAFTDPGGVHCCTVVAETLLATYLLHPQSTEYTLCYAMEYSYMYNIVRNTNPLVVILILNYVVANIVCL